MPRGGARAGAGRPRSGKRMLNLWVTTDEERKILTYLKMLRKNNKNQPTLQELENAGQIKIF